MIKTIIFDMGNVLVPFDFKRGYRTMGELAGLSPEEVRSRIAGTDIVHRFESGLIEPKDFVTQLCGQIGHQIGYDDFSTIWSSVFLPETLIREDLVRKLRENYRMLVLSNTNYIHWHMLKETYPIVNLFHDYVLSYEVKAMKPEEAIYRAAIEKAECRAEECFFTDDVLAYVEAARKYGIDAVQFVSCDQTEAELRGRGVEW